MIFLNIDSKLIGYIVTNDQAYFIINSCKNHIFIYKEGFVSLLECPARMPCHKFEFPGVDTCPPKANAAFHLNYSASMWASYFFGPYFFTLYQPITATHRSDDRVGHLFISAIRGRRTIWVLKALISTPQSTTKSRVHLILWWSSPTMEFQEDAWVKWSWRIL